ncbi:MAG: helix-turn-helix domain-containing protein [Desulfotalea sp.]
MSFHMRLQEVARIKKVDQVDLSAATDTNPSTVSKWWNGKRIPGAKNTRMLADYFGCNISWLECGKGELFPNNYTPPSGLDINFDLGKKKNLSNLVSITYFEDTYASAGKGIINYDAGKEVMHFDRKFLTSQIGTTNFDNVHIVHAVGDSMKGSINPGDLLFINPGDKEVITGAVYVFVIGEETLVKRAERNPLTGELTLRSDNEQYSPIEIHKTDLEKVIVVGRVIGNFKKF